VRKVIILVIGALFLHALVRDLNMIRVIILCAALASAYGVSRIPAGLIFRGKHPLIGLCLALSPTIFFYPALRPLQITAGAAILLGFYSIALFLVTADERGNELYKEVTGLTLLYGATVFNLFLAGHSELVLPLSISVLIFLFIINRVAIMPYLAAYTAGLVIFFVARGIPILGSHAPLRTIEQYFVLGCAFILFLFAFVAFLKKTDLITALGFFGLLYVSVDLLMSVGLRIKGVLLYQPVLGFCIVGPLIGVMMKGGKERI
jgi:hypothetical protein